jgi:hypothetical protein
MKFYGRPNKLVIVKPNKPYGRVRKIKFDEHGEVEINNPKLIKRMQKKFRYDAYNTLDDGTLVLHDALDDLTYNQLKELAKKNDIPNYYSVKKEILIDTLRTII